MNESVVEVYRGSLMESRHRVHVAVADATGRLRARTGDVDRITYARSAIKPIQALPLIEDGVADRFEFGEQEIAICCASHNGEARHVELVRGMLRRIGADEGALACGAQVPLGRAAARSLTSSGAKPAMNGFARIS